MFSHFFVMVLMLRPGQTPRTGTVASPFFFSNQFSLHRQGGLESGHANNWPWTIKSCEKHGAVAGGGWEHTD
jgi:hypothetical protein